MKKIIALYGAQNRGKTTTLNILVELLREVADSYDIYNETDSWAWFVINKKIVSVCTSGDNATIVRNNIDNYKDCDIFISSSRTKGGSVNEIEKLGKQEKIIIEWILKEDNEGKNKIIATDLFCKIIDFVKG